MVNNATLEVMERIAFVQGHQHPRMTLSKSHSQVFFFQGESNIGKKESALEWIRLLSCPNAQHGAPCNVCESCLQHFFFRSKNVFWCSLENTLDYVGFLLKQYQKLTQNLAERHFAGNHNEPSNEISGETTNKINSTINHSQGAKNASKSAFFGEKERYLRGIRLQIRREMMRILLWHRSGIFPMLKEKKKSFAQGVVLEEQQLAHYLTQVHKWLECEWFFSEERPSGEKFEKKGFSETRREEVFAVVSALHHCFDRSMIVKEVLDKMMHFCWREKDSTGPYFVFIDPIEKIHPHLVSSLLKILEEPPRNVYFFLFSSSAASMSEQMLSPLLSRVINLRFSRLNNREIMNVAQKKWLFFDDEQQRQAVESSLAIYGENLDFSLFFQWNASLNQGGGHNDFSGVVKKIFVEHEKLKQRGGFKKNLQIGLLLSDFSSAKDSLPTISLRRLLGETKYAIRLFLESRVMGKKLNFPLPFYMSQKKITDCKIFLHKIEQLESFLEKNTLREESIFFKWLLLLQQT